MGCLPGEPSKPRLCHWPLRHDHRGFTVGGIADRRQSSIRPLAAVGVGPGLRVTMWRVSAATITSTASVARPTRPTPAFGPASPVPSPKTAATMTPQRHRHRPRPRPPTPSSGLGSTPGTLGIRGRHRWHVNDDPHPRGQDVETDVDTKATASVAIGTKDKRSGTAAKNVRTSRERQQVASTPIYRELNPAPANAKSEQRLNNF